MVEKLRCKHCDQIKPLDQFNRDFFGKKGYDVYCHSCRTEIDQRQISVTEKRCRSCKILKPISMFGITASSRDGYTKECIACRQDYQRRKRWRLHNASWNGKHSICRICNSRQPTFEFVVPRDKTGYVYCRSCISEMNQRKYQRYSQEREIKGYPIEKTCKQCGRILPSDQFSLNRCIRDGLSEKCLECQEEWRKQWKQRNIQRNKNKTRKKNQRKECSICHAVKPLSEFTKDKTRKDGLSANCRSCVIILREDNINVWQKQQKKQSNKPPKTLECRVCHRQLSIEMFTRNRQYKNGYNYCCKDCHKENERLAEQRWERERKKALLEFTLDATVEKTCRICGKTKPLSEFGIRYASKDGHAHYCKTCSRIKEKQRNKMLKQRGFPEDQIPETKRCPHCKKILPRDMFRRNALSSDGLDGRCKTCRNEYYQEYYHRKETQEKMKAYSHQPEVMKRRRRQARAYYRKPGVKEKQNAYKREYIKRPYVKKRRRDYDKEYQKRPEVKQRRKEYDRRPEVRKRRNESTKRWRDRKKLEEVV